MNYRFSKNPELRSTPLVERIPRWLKRNLFNGPVSSVVSIFLLALVWKIIEGMIDWIFFKGIWFGTAAECRTQEGACVAFVIEKFYFILFGFYPRAEIWRPTILMLSLFFLLFYTRRPKNWTKQIIILWVVFSLISFLIMKGGVFGLEEITTDQWGGLPLTLILATVGISLSYPLGILLALARRSRLPALKAMSIGYIELIRGVPLISLLFMASVMFPLMLPEGLNVSKLLRAQIAIIMFISAYMAEVVRGGLAGIERGQYEAADALGLSYWQSMRLVILPQALRIAIPPTVNTAIGMLKDTSLVLIIALFDLLNTTKTALKDPEWLGFSVEGYIFVGIIYFVICFSLGRASRNLEHQLQQN